MKIYPPIFIGKVENFVGNSIFLKDENGLIIHFRLGILWSSLAFHLHQSDVMLIDRYGPIVKPVQEYLIEFSYTDLREPEISCFILDCKKIFTVIQNEIKWGWYIKTSVNNHFIPVVNEININRFLSTVSRKIIISPVIVDAITFNKFILEHSQREWQFHKENTQEIEVYVPDGRD